MNFDWKRMPISAVCVWDGVYQPQCQRCGSHAITVRDDTSRAEVAVICKDCGEGTSDPDAAKAWRYFLRPRMNASTLEERSRAAAEAAAHAYGASACFPSESLAPLAEGE